MIENNHSLKVIDFGMAKKVNSPFVPQIDLSKTVVGTLPYMVNKNWGKLFNLNNAFNLLANFLQAPELLEFNTYDSRIDVWSLGILIYEMVTGEPFFRINDLSM